MERVKHISSIHFIQFFSLDFPNYVIQFFALFQYQKKNEYIRELKKNMIIIDENEWFLRLQKS